MAAARDRRGHGLGAAALSGWRRRVATSVAGPVARRSPLDRERVERLIGVVFFALAALYTARTVVRVVRGA